MQGLASAMEWKPEQRPLDELGLAGICHEILRVLIAILPGFKNKVHAVLLFVHVAVSGTFFSRLFSGGVTLLLRLILPSFDILIQGNAFRLVAHVAVCIAFFSGVVSRLVSTLLHLIIVCPLLLLVLMDVFSVMIYDRVFVIVVDSLYRTKGAVRVGALDLVTNDIRTRHLPTFVMAVALLGGCVAVSGDAWRALRLPHAPGEIIVLSLQQLLGGAACLAGTAYIALVCQLACVVSVLEDASGLGAMRRSRALLAGGNCWRAAAVLALLDGSLLAAMMTIPVALWDEDDALGVGGILQVALCAVLAVVTLVAQPVVYRVLCHPAARNYQ